MLDRQITPPVPESILDGNNPNWVNDFRRWAEKLAAESEARTGYPLPGNQGFTVGATPKPRSQSRPRRAAA